MVFYFAGHGQTEDLAEGRKRGYIIPVDAEKSDYSSTAISMEQIRSLSYRFAFNPAEDSCTWIPVHSYQSLREGVID